MKKLLIAAFVLLTALSSCNSGETKTSTTESASATDSLRAIVKEAYVYGFPMVDAYRIQDAYFINTKSPDFKAPINQIASFANVLTPKDTIVQAPNSDTPYSFGEFDLRAEPVVLTVPPI